MFVSALKSTEAPESLKVNPPPSKSIPPVALIPPTTCNSVEGEAVLIPILSLPASVKNKFASPLPYILKSKSALDSLKTNVPPSSDVLPLTVNVPFAFMLPASSNTSNIVDPSEYKICFDEATRFVAVPPAGLNPKV